MLMHSTFSVCDAASWRNIMNNSANLSQANRGRMMAEILQSVHCMRCRTVRLFCMRRNELPSLLSKSNDSEFHTESYTFA